MSLHRTFVMRDAIAAKQLWAFLRANWHALAVAGRPLSVTVSEHKAKRSGDQNRLYWALLSEIAESAWVDGRQFSREAWHAHFAGQFIGYEETPGGHPVPISTTTLSVAEFSAYIERVQQYASEQLGIETCIA